MIKKLFETLEEYRHLPSYKLENRLDLIFSFYLAKVFIDSKAFDLLNEKSESTIVIPEFPIRASRLKSSNFVEDSCDNNYQMKHIDFAVFFRQSKVVVFAELKTDISYVDQKQLKDLYKLNSKCRNITLDSILQDIIKVHREKRSKKPDKYAHLIHKLDNSSLNLIDVTVEDEVDTATMYWEYYKDRKKQARTRLFCIKPFDNCINWKIFTAYISPYKCSKVTTEIACCNLIDVENEEVSDVKYTLTRYFSFAKFAKHLPSNNQLDQKFTCFVEVLSCDNNNAGSLDLLSAD